MSKTPKEPKPENDSKLSPSSKAITASTEEDWTSIRTKQPLILPNYVRSAVQKLNEGGYVAYIVGGSVRDFLLGVEPKDHDIATDARPEALSQLFPDALEVGREFGVFKLPVPDAPVLEIATFREDMEYRDHRHPIGVKFSNPQVDALRRDFTINGLFYDPKAQRIIDFVQGQADLRNKIIRAIGDPQKRFAEDALRLLRAIRFSAQLNFPIEPDTTQAIKISAPLLKKVSAERVRDEMELMLAGPRPALAIELMLQTGLMEQVIPELVLLSRLPQPSVLKKSDTAWRNMIRLVRTLRKYHGATPSALNWAALLLGVGKPTAWRKNEGKSLTGYEAESAELAKKICRRLRLPNEVIEEVAILVSEHVRFNDAFLMRDATLHRWVSQPYFENLLKLHHSETLATDGNLIFYDFCRSKWQEVREAPEVPTLVDGDDLIQLGLRPGPEFKEILRVIEDLTIENQLKTKEEALEYIINHYVR